MDSWLCFSRCVVASVRAKHRMLFWGLRIWFLCSFLRLIHVFCASRSGVCSLYRNGWRSGPLIIYGNARACYPILLRRQCWCEIWVPGHWCQVDGKLCLWNDFFHCTWVGVWGRLARGRGSSDNHHFLSLSLSSSAPVCFAAYLSQCFGRKFITLCRALVLFALLVVDFTSVLLQWFFDLSRCCQAASSILDRYDERISVCIYC